MKKYPMPFPVSSSSPQGIKSSWSGGTDKFPNSVTLSIPPEFEGPGDGLSPEDLYALALQNCFIATFKVFAEKSRLSYSHVHSKATLEVDRNESGAPWMARIHLDVWLEGAQSAETALHILEKTSKSCMILNSVNTVKTFDFKIS